MRVALTSLNMVEQPKAIKLVGHFIRQRREALGLSQRALGLLFSPPVTTQFISNVERGVTPLPPIHIPVLIKALLVSEQELLSLLEREYTLKLTGRVGGRPEENGSAAPSPPQIMVTQLDYEFFRRLYDAYRGADEKTKLAFVTVSESMLKTPRKPAP